MKTMEDLKQDVIDELAWSTSLNTAAIGVAASDGAVTLTGHVPTYADKRAAEKAAKRVKGVIAVANDLEVRLPSSLQRDDTDIAALIVSVLRWNVQVPKTVKATVEHGWVTLEGEVDWAFQSTAAEKAVRDLVGIRGVTNLIRVKARVAPKNVQDLIHRAFHRSAQIDADNVRVHISDGKVTLTGDVRSFSERIEAEHAARAAAGVVSVDNQVRVSPLITSVL